MLEKRRFAQFLSIPGRSAAEQGRRALAATRARRRACALLGGLAASALLAPSIAQAETTLGQTAFNGNVDPCLNAGYSEVQTATSGGPGYAAPTNGVITSWSFMGNDDTNDIVKLRIFRPTATSGQFMVVGDSTQQGPMKPDALNGPFPTSITVKAGDLLGNYTAAGSNPSCTYPTGRPGDVEQEFLPDTTAVGGTESSTFTSTETRVNISATFRPTACVVPKLKGDKLKGAKQALKAAGCRLGKVKSKGKGKAKVKKQKPKAGSVLAPGARVKVTV